jgi:hypothetical protein
MTDLALRDIQSPRAVMAGLLNGPQDSDHDDARLVWSGAAAQLRGKERR